MEKVHFLVKNINKCFIAKINVTRNLTRKLLHVCQKLFAKPAFVYHSLIFFDGIPSSNNPKTLHPWHIRLYFVQTFWKKYWNIKFYLYWKMFNKYLIFLILHYLIISKESSTSIVVLEPRFSAPNVQEVNISFVQNSKEQL